MKILSNKDYRELIAEKELTELSLKSLKSKYDFIVEENKTRNIEIIMNVDSWFKTPYIYDHNYWGGAIMQNQPAMQMVKENGVDVFSVARIE